ncbi:MAG: nucleotide exchange factor GrpE [Planctomycetota bacterium]
MGIGERLLRFFKRRQSLRRLDREARNDLQTSDIAELAPEIAGAIRALRGTVASTAHDAVTLAYDALVPYLNRAISDVRQALEEDLTLQRKGLVELTRRLGEEVERTRRELEEHGGQLASLRQIYTEHGLRTQRLEEGYDWSILKEFCFRFIRILDGIERRIASPGPDESHALEELHAEILFALEAGGVEQFAPEPGTPFSGNEKQLKVVGKSPAQNRAELGLVAAVRCPGYSFVQADRPDRVLRPAHVEVFEAPNLQETSS